MSNLCVRKQLESSFNIRWKGLDKYTMKDKNKQKSRLFQFLFHCNHLNQMLVLFMSSAFLPVMNVISRNQLPVPSFVVSSAVVFSWELV